MPDRQPGKLGLLPQRQGDARYAIRWAHEYLTGEVVIDYPVDVSRGLTDWGMLGNDEYSDCVPAAVAHERMLADAIPSVQDVLDVYFAYNDGHDNGVVIADFLLWLFQQGWIDGFAPVEPDKIDATMAGFNRGILLGASLTRDAEQLFADGQPWTLAHGEYPDSMLGHGILKVKSDARDGDGTVVTWGADQGASGAWFAACIDEAWIVLTKDDEHMIDFPQLDVDLRALPKVTVGPEPEPAPAPEPEPEPDQPPTPPATLDEFVNRLKEIVADAEQEVIDKIDALADLFRASLGRAR